MGNGNENDEFSFDHGDDVETTLRNYGRGLSKVRRDLDALQTKVMWFTGAGATIGALFTLFSKQILAIVGAAGGH